MLVYLRDQKQVVVVVAVEVNTKGDSFAASSMSLRSGVAQVLTFFSPYNKI